MYGKKRICTFIVNLDVVKFVQADFEIARFFHWFKIFIRQGPVNRVTEVKSLPTTHSNRTF